MESIYILKLSTQAWTQYPDYLTGSSFQKPKRLFLLFLENNEERTRRYGLLELAERICLISKWKRRAYRNVRKVTTDQGEDFVSEDVFQIFHVSTRALWNDFYQSKETGNSQCWSKSGTID